MIRTLVAAFCLLTVLNVAASACDGTECTATTKPLNILQFMRQQAASTRILNPLPKKASGVVGNTRPRNSDSLIARANSARTALRGPIPAVTKRAIRAANKKPVFHSRSLLARRTFDKVPVAASSFAAQEPFVQVVTSDEANAIDLAAGSADASTSKAQTALQLVSQAFDEIDRKNDGSLTVEDLQAAGERAQGQQSGLSWLQQTWLAIIATINGVRAD